MGNIAPAYVLLGFVALPVDIVGTIGNLALLVVLSKRRCDKPMYIILKWMSATNVLLLVLNMLFQALPAIWHVTNFKNSWYKFAVFNGNYIQPIATAAHFVKVWLTVLLSVERWTAVCCPLKFRSNFSSSRVHFLIGLTFLAAIAYNLPRYFEPVCFSVRPSSSNFSVTNDTRTLRCAPATSFFLSIWYRLGYGVGAYMIFLFLLPIGTVIVLNCHIIYEIHKGNSTLAVLTIVQKFERRISKVPLAMAIVFCVLQSPALIVNILHFAGWGETSGLQNTVLWKSLLGMAVILVLVDSLADFILYFYNMNCSCRVFVANFRGARRSRSCERSYPRRIAVYSKASNEFRYNPVTSSRLQESWVC